MGVPTHYSIQFLDINPFKGKNISNIKISCTNIRGMKIGSNCEEKKLGTLLDLNSDIVFLIDHHMDDRKLASLLKNNRKILSQFSVHGTPSLKRGILTFVKKKFWMQNHLC